MATVDGKKTGGRQKGQLNKRTKLVDEMAANLDVNPFEILLRFSAGDWEGLGYPTRTRKMLTKTGEVIELDRIEPCDRIASAKAACEYLHSKRKTVELTDADGKNPFQSFGELMKNILTKDNEHSS